MVRYTRHYENETLYWTKAASVLGLPQRRLPSSEVPLPASKAAADLREFLERNGCSAPDELNSERALFRAWSDVCRTCGPLFLEKSPHSLYQRSVVDLMERYADAAEDVDVHFIGLVRNPMATLYSCWRRWGIRPHAEERLWRLAYQNLLSLAERRPDQVCIMRYEDIVRGDDRLLEILAARGIPHQSGHPETAFHANSLRKWAADHTYGFTLSPETVEVAARFGYHERDLENPHAGPWVLHRMPRAALYRCFHALPDSIKNRARTHFR